MEQVLAWARLWAPSPEPQKSKGGNRLGYWLGPPRVRTGITLSLGLFFRGTPAPESASASCGHVEARTSPELRGQG